MPVNVSLVLVPYDTARRDWGMGRGPAHLLSAGLVEALTSVGHAVELSTVDAAGDDQAEVRTAFQLMAGIADAVRRAREANRFPLVLAGNCNTAVGTVAGLDHIDHTGVVWFDAHGDFNTPETTVTGSLDGMALAMLTGRCWTELSHRVPGFSSVQEDASCLVGARDLDALESLALDQSRVWRVPPEDASRRLPAVSREIAARAAGAYLHIDLDVLDLGEGRVNRYASPGGLSAEALVAAIADVGAQLPLRAAALTAYDPGFDRDGAVGRIAVRVVQAILEATSHELAL
jgi:arginase